MSVSQTAFTDSTVASALSGSKRMFLAPARAGDSRRRVIRLTRIPPPTVRPLWTTGVRDAALARPLLQRPVVLAARGLDRFRNASGIDLAAHLARRRSEVISRAQANATLASYASADRSFLEFCEVLGLNFDNFGLPVEDGGYAVWEEDEILCLWLIYGCENPRRRGLANLTAETMFKYLSGLRHSVQMRHKRRPGRPVAEAFDLRLVQRGLSKLYPSGQKAPREPILRSHLVAIRGELDLENSQLDRVCWALWLCCWGLVSRSGDFLRRRARGHSPWEAYWDCHRGRVTFAHPLADAPNGVIGSMEIALPPGKTDQTGKMGLKKYSLVDASPDSVCCGMAVHSMLYHSQLPAGVLPEDVPLFQDPRSGAEISYAYAQQRFQSIFAKCFPGYTPGMHSLRAGGGTSAYCVGGESAASAMGHWQGDSKWRYFFTLRSQIESVSLQMGRVDQGPVASLARGPLATARRAP